MRLPKYFFRGLLEEHPIRRYDVFMVDLNQLAHRIVQESTDFDRPAKTPAQTNGRNGGLKGGKARAEKLSAVERSEIAQKAAKARWAKAL